MKTAKGSRHARPFRGFRVFIIRVGFAGQRGGSIGSESNRSILMEEAQSLEAEEVKQVDTVTVQVELPRDLLVALNVTASEAGRRAQEWLTIELFREGEISTGKAAEILGVTKTQFILLLDQRNVDYLDLSPDELLSDVEAASTASRRSKGE